MRGYQLDLEKKTITFIGVEEDRSVSIPFADVRFLRFYDQQFLVGLYYVTNAGARGAVGVDASLGMGDGPAALPVVFGVNGDLADGLFMRLLHTGQPFPSPRPWF